MGRWQELSAHVGERLEGASSGERSVFAAGVADRLMAWHEGLPADEQAPFTVSLRPLLDAVWEGALGGSTAFAAVNRGVAEFMLSEYCHNDGQDGPNDADEDAAAATLYAAHAYLFGCADFAVLVSGRAIDEVDRRIQERAEQEAVATPPVETDAALAAELRRQLCDLDLIARYAKELRYAGLGLPVDTCVRLRTELRVPLSCRE